MYQDVFEYDYPLMNPEPMVFHFVQPDEQHEYSNPWKESFRQLVSFKFPFIQLLFTFCVPCMVVTISQYGNIAIKSHIPV